mmetsp:Transcript_4377/g.10480  ORF Transcript_4377/g.10480 Transcript_4377/m.10480 type:complete len:705 (+) Transcript_4377:246-2360(+)
MVHFPELEPLPLPPQSLQPIPSFLFSRDLLQEKQDTMFQNNYHFNPPNTNEIGNYSNCNTRLNHQATQPSGNNVMNSNIWGQLPLLQMRAPDLSSLFSIHCASNLESVRGGTALTPSMAMIPTGTITSAAPLPAKNRTVTFSDLQRQLFSEGQFRVPGIDAFGSYNQSASPSLVLDLNHQNQTIGTNAITTNATMTSRKRTLRESSSFELQQQSGVWDSQSLSGPIPALLPRPSSSSFEVTGAKKPKTSHGKRNLSLSISRAVRQRFQSMTRNSRLVQKKLPPIVIESGNPTHNILNDGLRNQREADSVVSLVLPASTLYVRKSKEPQETQVVPHHQVFLRTHKLLGEGAFATVTSVTIEDSRHSACAANTSSHYYACKFIKEELFSRASKILQDSNGSGDCRDENGNYIDPKHRRAYVQAESQLAYEAHLLGSLNHRNIVQLMGFFPATSNKFPEMERSFCLTEILDETLAQKLFCWKNGQGANTNALEKLSICQQLANALEHVHSKNIAYRDLKPENVGFSGSTLKLFDFGLSREMLQKKQNVDSKTPSTVPSSLQSSASSISLRGMVGTMRYMAPEVCLEESYDCDCDIYSYSVLCWEVWTQKTPYAILTPTSYLELVCLKDVRPPEIAAKVAQKCVNNKNDANRSSEVTTTSCGATIGIPKVMEDLLEKGWVRDPTARIRWRNIHQELSQIQQWCHRQQM